MISKELVPLFLFPIFLWAFTELSLKSCTISSIWPRRLLSAARDKWARAAHADAWYVDPMFTHTYIYNSVEICFYIRRPFWAGHKELDKGKLAPYLWREDYCGACGTQHSNPHLLDTYYTCEVWLYVYVWLNVYMNLYVCTCIYISIFMYMYMYVWYVYTRFVPGVL